MAAIGRSIRKVYYAPTARRHYLTPKAAASNEAKAMIRRKYPTEKSDTDEFGRCYDPGWHWTGDSRLVRLHERLTAMLYWQFKSRYGARGR